MAAPGHFSHEDQQLGAFTPERGGEFAHNRRTDTGCTQRRQQGVEQRLLGRGQHGAMVGQTQADAVANHLSLIDQHADGGIGDHLGAPWLRASPPGFALGCVPDHAWQGD